MVYLDSHMSLTDEKKIQLYAGLLLWGIGL